jgi:hypothetical protein
VNKEKYPILAGLVESFCRIRSTLELKNLMDSAIFENPNFLLPNTNIVIKSTFF